MFRICSMMLARPRMPKASSFRGMTTSSAAIRASMAAAENAGGQSIRTLSYSSARSLSQSASAMGSVPSWLKLRMSKAIRLSSAGSRSTPRSLLGYALAVMPRIRSLIPPRTRSSRGPRARNSVRLAWLSASMQSTRRP